MRAAGRAQKRENKERGYVRSGAGSTQSRVDDERRTNDDDDDGGDGEFGRSPRVRREMSSPACSIHASPSHQSNIPYRAIV